MNHVCTFDCHKLPIAFVIHLKTRDHFHVSHHALKEVCLTIKNQARCSILRGRR